MIETLVSYLTELIKSIGYWGVGISMFIESFFAPIPSELIMPFAGFVASQGFMSIHLVILVGAFGSYLGSLPFYLLGYWGNEIIVNKFLRKFGKYLFISDNDIDLGFSYFDKYGSIIVLLGRLVPIVRTVISFPAGVAKMNFWKFSTYTLFGSVLWSGLLAVLGYVFGENWEVIGGYISEYEKIVVYAFLGILFLFVMYKLYKRKK